jgi:hypothetical protein
MDAWTVGQREDAGMNASRADSRYRRTDTVDRPLVHPPPGYRLKTQSVLEEYRRISADS